LTELVEGSGCGIAIDDLSESTAAIRQMLGDRDGYRARAFACFREHFDFAVKFKGVLDDLDAIALG
jgi:hypothetical protein